MNPTQFRNFVVKPTLLKMGMHSQAAEDLLLGTALTESNLEWLTQHGDGPALGVYQIEPATFKDIWNRYLIARPDLNSKVEQFAGAAPDHLTQLQTNLAFATAIARIKYWMDPAPLPSPHDMNHASYVYALGEVWKKCYNSELGAGTVDHFVSKYRG